MSTREQIVEVCKPVLESVGNHVTKTIYSGRFITAYQVWAKLKAAGSPIVDELIAECGDDYVGKGAGSNVGPVQKIAQALGHHSDIETQYLLTDSIVIDDDTPGGKDCGLFRLR